MNGEERWIARQDQMAEESWGEYHVRLQEEHEAREEAAYEQRRIEAVERMAVSDPRLIGEIIERRPNGITFRVGATSNGDRSNGNSGANGARGATRARASRGTATRHRGSRRTSSSSVGDSSDPDLDPPRQRRSAAQGSKR